MFLPSSPPVSGRCPDPRALADFNSGRLAEPLLESIAHHLAGCETCLGALSEIQQHAARAGIDARLRPVLREANGAVRPNADGPPGASTKRIKGGGKVGIDHPPTGREAFVGMVFGPYTLLEEIGEGGMGVVYRAEQKPVERVVALKTLRDLYCGGPDQRARFRTEGAALARLHHPNVVRLYHFDDHDGRPYFTMELVEGGSLADKVRAGPLPFREAAEIVRATADAVGYAHEQKVIHRDLKPKNVLMAPDGTPKVTDFGLAKMLDEGREKLTETDMIMGTPSYMSPEQAAGRAGEIGPGTDVYALGAILYELLCGVPPFVADSKLNILRLVQEGNVVPPSRLREEIPPDLEAVCLKCLETPVGWRYDSADALAADLGRWLQDKPTHARPLTRARRALRWARRHARRGAAVACALILTVGSAVVAMSPRPPLTADAPDGESETVRRELEADLASGRPVTLVGDTGRPKWFRWHAGGDAQRTHIEPDGAFSAEMIKRASGMLELLPAVKVKRYKLAAQVRHELGNPAGMVGLYFAHHTQRAESREVQCFARVEFNAVAAVPEYQTVPPRVRVPKDHTEGMFLSMRLLPGPNSPSKANCEFGVIHGPWMVARGARNGVWHDLEVTVTPGGITAVVNGNAMVMPASMLTREGLYQSIAYLRRYHPEDPFVQNFHPEFAPGGGLGLSLHSLSAASIRRVTVTPLPDDKNRD